MLVRPLPATRFLPMPYALRSLCLAAIALPLVATVACTSAQSPTAPTIETTAFAPALGVNLAASTKMATGVYYRDLIVGTGTTAASGQMLSVLYSGFLANGTQFASNTAANPLAFTLGAGQLIAGLDQGLVGMKVGGRRQVIIPPSLGYGASANGAIPGNSILVFTIDLLGIQ
jgi:FKBP-type peptidyl-prolyl cis-trans isomerase